MVAVRIIKTFFLFLKKMREKSNKFRRGQGRKKSVALKKDDISWLSKNTHFDPETVTEWHKVRKVFLLIIKVFIRTISVPL